MAVSAMAASVFPFNHLFFFQHDHDREEDCKQDDKVEQIKLAAAEKVSDRNYKMADVRRMRNEMKNSLGKSSMRGGIRLQYGPHKKSLWPERKNA